MKHMQLLDKYNFDDTNKFQKDALNHGLLGGENFVISTPTASGKTFMAILAIDECISNGDKAVYVSPTRAISKQVKHELFKLGKVEQIIGGKKIDNIDQLLDFEITVFTIEKFIEIFFKFPEFLKDVGVIVFDEIHFISDVYRGPLLECIIMLLLHEQEKYYYRIIAMSATMDNIEDLVKWMKSDYYFNNEENEKEVLLVEREGKSLVLTNGKSTSVSPIYNYELFHLSRENMYDHEFDILSATNNLVQEGKRVLVLCTSRMLTEEYYKQYKEITKDERTHIHHAKLKESTKTMVENLAKRGEFSVIFSTTTLNYGVDFAFDAIILTSDSFYQDLKEGKLHDTITLKQAIGRAGRKKGEKAIIYALGRERKISENIINYLQEPVKLVSQLHMRPGKNILQKFLAAALNNKIVGTVDDMCRLIESSFAHKKNEKDKLDEIVWELNEFLINPIVELVLDDTIYPNNEESIINLLVHKENHRAEVKLKFDWQPFITKSISPKQLYYVIKEYIRQYDGKEIHPLALAKIVAYSSPEILSELNEKSEIWLYDKKRNYLRGLNDLDILHPENDVRVLKLYSNILRRMTELLEFLYFAYQKMNKVFNEGSNFYLGNEFSQLFNDQQERLKLQQSLRNLKKQFFGMNFMIS